MWYSVHTCGRGLKSECIKNVLHHRHELNRSKNAASKLMAWEFVCGRKGVCHIEISFHPFSLFFFVSLSHTHICMHTILPHHNTRVPELLWPMKTLSGMWYLSVRLHQPVQSTCPVACYINKPRTCSKANFWVPQLPFCQQNGMMMVSFSGEELSDLY